MPSRPKEGGKYFTFLSLKHKVKIKALEFPNWIEREETTLKEAL